jgi:metallopeptidase MepB
MHQPPIKFPVTPVSITADAESLVRESRHRRDELIQNISLEQATFANVMLPLAHMQNDFTMKANLLSFYRHVSADDNIRTASAKAQTLFDSFHTECWMRKDIFKLVDAVYRNRDDVTSESSLFLEIVCNRYTRSGLGIRDAVSRERFKEIQGRLSQIHTEFRRNLGRQTDVIFFTLAELEGVPESIVTQLEKDTSNN